MLFGYEYWICVLLPSAYMYASALHIAVMMILLSCDGHPVLWRDNAFSRGAADGESCELRLFVVALAFQVTSCM